MNLRVNPSPILMPCQFDLYRCFRGTVLENSHLESVAHAVVILSRSCDPDKWMPFSYEHFVASIRPRIATEGDRRALDELVTRGLLDFEGDLYMVNDKFVTEFSPYATALNKGFAGTAYMHA